VEHRHAGGIARVTTLEERALVDVLDAPEHGGGAGKTPGARWSRSSSSISTPSWRTR
jgi:hypothetical protein